MIRNLSQLFLLSIIVMLGPSISAQTPLKLDEGGIHCPSNYISFIDPAKLARLNIAEIHVDPKKGDSAYTAYVLNSAGLLIREEYIDKGTKYPYVNYTEYGGDTLPVSFYQGFILDGRGTYSYYEETEEVERSPATSRSLPVNGYVGTFIHEQNHKRGLSRKVSKKTDSVGNLLYVDEHVWNADNVIIEENKFLHKSATVDSAKQCRDGLGRVRRIRHVHLEAEKESDQGVPETQEAWDEVDNEVFPPGRMVNNSMFKVDLSVFWQFLGGDEHDFYIPIEYRQSPMSMRFYLNSSSYTRIFKYNTRGDRYMVLEKNANGDTTEFMLRDSLYLIPLHHKVLSSGKLLETVKVEKRTKLGAPIEVVEQTPYGSILRQCYVDRDEKDNVERVRLGNPWSMEQLYFASDGDLLEKQTIYINEDDKKGQKSFLKTSKGFDKAGEILGIDFTFSTRKNTANLPSVEYFNEKGRNGCSVSFENTETLVVKRYEWINGVWYTKSERRYGPYGLLQELEINPDTLDAIKEGMLSGKFVKPRAKYEFVYSAQGNLLESWNYFLGDTSKRELTYTDDAELRTDTRFSIKNGVPVKNYERIQTRSVTNEGSLEKREVVYFSGGTRSNLEENLTYFDVHGRPVEHRSRAGAYPNVMKEQRINKIAYDTMMSKDRNEYYMFKQRVSLYDDTIRSQSNRYVEKNVYNLKGYLVESVKGYFLDEDFVEVRRYVYSYDPETDLLLRYDYYDSRKLTSRKFFSYIQKKG